MPGGDGRDPAGGLAELYLLVPDQAPETEEDGTKRARSRPLEPCFTAAGARVGRVLVRRACRSAGPSDASRMPLLRGLVERLSIGLALASQSQLARTTRGLAEP